jgi:hypothetical protein
VVSCSFSIVSKVPHKCEGVQSVFVSKGRKKFLTQTLQNTLVS